MTVRPRSLKTVGLGAAACAACCAGPIFGLIAATGILTATGIAMFGLVGIVVAIPGLVLAARRRNQTLTCAAGPERVDVAIPTRVDNPSPVRRS